MAPEQLFPLVNLVAILSWILLASLPKQRWVVRMASGLAVPAVLAVIYTVIVATNWFGSPGGFSTLSDVALLFSNRWLLLAGWTHYLAFDLLVGCWEVGDAGERGVPHLLVVPCLLLTFLFGPAGWLLYLAVRSAHRRQDLRPAGHRHAGAG
jgi:hypothetical protein